MGYKVIFAAQAERDLGVIVGFLAAKSPAAAEKLGLALVDSAIALGQLPRRGVPVRGRPGVHKMPHRPHHLIFYQIDEGRNLVEVLRFWDGRQHPATNPLPPIS